MMQSKSMDKGVAATEVPDFEPEFVAGPDQRHHADARAPAPDLPLAGKDVERERDGEDPQRAHSPS